ncbi:hypothetical protein BRADI_1g76726v3 [Brachypodium distachyon]|uniref:Uncharacterized protein n=1 Tax=Brachypodium distachyon TaxID=15368 RepID=A0A0Q3LKQ4_BRADI|nr:hypothetical protein BRADI_1g76726v3 [Brachypodium distachyon]
MNTQLERKTDELAGVRFELNLLRRRMEIEILQYESKVAILERGAHKMRTFRSLVSVLVLMLLVAPVNCSTIVNWALLVTVGAMYANQAAARPILLG